MFGRNGEPLTPFRCGVLLSVARVARYELQILDIIKKRVAKQCRFATAATHSGWLEAHNALGPSAVDTQDLSGILRALVAHSAHGWDIVVPAIVQLGVLLVEAAPGKGACVFGPLWSEGPLGQVLFVSPPSAVVYMAAIGVLILRDTFYRHKAARPAVLEQVRALLSVCVCRALGGQEFAPPVHLCVFLQILSRVGMLDSRTCVFLSLLHHLCRVWPHLVLEHCGKVKVCVVVRSFAS